MLYIRKKFPNLSNSLKKSYTYIIMNKEEYKQSLLVHYPSEPDDVLELARHFHSVEKAKRYIELLETCNSYSDLATKAVREMYVSCDIDREKAMSEKFIAALLPFVCMERRGKPHSASFHIRKMLVEDDTVKAERKAEEERLRRDYRTQSQTDSLPRTYNITMQFQLTTDNEELVRQIMLLASQSNAVFIKEEGNRPDDQSISMSHTMDHTSKRNTTEFLYMELQKIGMVQTIKKSKCKLICTAKGISVFLINLRSIFGVRDQYVKCTDSHNRMISLPMSELQKVFEGKSKYHRRRIRFRNDE